VARDFHCLPEAAGQRRTAELLALYKKALRAQWDNQVAAITAIELGTGRALAQAFGGKRVKLPALPDFDELMRARLPAEKRLPGWMVEFERANAKHGFDGDDPPQVSPE